MKSALGAPDDEAGTPMRANRCPFVATIRILPSRSSQSTPLRIGRLSSVEAANAVWWMSDWRSEPATCHPPSKDTSGRVGNSSAGKPFSLKRLCPQLSSIWSPRVETATGWSGSSRAISWSFFPGAVMFPCSVTSAGTFTRTATSRSVPLIQTPSSAASNRIFERTGRVVLVGMLAETAARPSCRFFRVIVKFIRPPLVPVPPWAVSTTNASL